MPQFAARIGFNVVYTAKDNEAESAERAHALADTMLAVLKQSRAVRTLAMQLDAVTDVECLDSPGVRPAQIRPPSQESE
jgi:acetolactate synthase regulatory subunit